MPATVRQYHEIAGVGEIMRRYFVINAFDGSLTTLGVLAGSYVAVVDKAATVISLILSTAVSIGVAGFYGSYQVERAERDRALRDIEESTLTSLHDTTLYSASRYATVIVALVDGISPLIASLLIMIPFLFVSPASTVRTRSSAPSATMPCGRSRSQRSPACRTPRSTPRRATLR